MRFLLEYSSFKDNFRRISQDDPFIKSDPNAFLNVKNIIERDCEPFLKLMEEKKLPPLLRGAHRPDPNTAVSTGLYKKKSRKDRRPMDMPYDIQYFFDEFFVRNFGWPARSSGVFSSFSKKTSYGYGSEDYIVLPIGEFSYLWNPDVKDLFTILEDYNFLYEPDEELYSEEYWAMNDEYSGLGTYHYDGEDTGKKIYKEVVDMFKEDENFDEGFIEWVPFKSLKVWIREREKERDDFFEKISNGYKDTDIEKAVDHEVILNCEEYYLLSSSYYDTFNEYIQSRNNI